MTGCPILLFEAKKTNHEKHEIHEKQQGGINIRIQIDSLNNGNRLSRLFKLLKVKIDFVPKRNKYSSEDFEARNHSG
jgi:hypothetical protein